ncbi:hypothetical protein MK805_00820 [Shimazuella sp. AN120528]|uniref:hypothetical protein n=1 Tax=Shimazuella soli TaxID=1892854 RepID=UPI001F0E88E0|nr:hypothetical protein [Shimazuella soli]MCH5583513.1 hypothetical protein [Shimazuella soli]
MKKGKSAGKVGGGALAALVLAALSIWGAVVSANPEQLRSVRNRAAGLRTKGSKLLNRR